MTSLEDFVSALNDSLTPSSSPPCEAQVECTASSFGKTFIGNVAQKLQWSEDQIKNADQLFTNTFFALASVNGLVTEKVDQADVPQLVFTTSALITYIEYLTYMLNTLNLLINGVQKQAELATQNQIDPNAYIESVTALHEFAQLTQYVVVHYDTEIPLTKNAIQVPALDEQMNTVFSAIVQLYNIAGAIYNDISQQNDPNTNYAQFMQLYNQISQVVPALVTMISQIKESLCQTITPIYSEPEYNDFQLFLKGFTKNSAMLYLISTIIGMSNTSSFHMTISVLKILSEQLHIIDSKITRILRFRGNFDTTVKEIHQAYQTMSEIFKPLLENLIQTIPMVQASYREAAEKSIVESFQLVQKDFADFNGKFENLLAAIKKDRRFSVFQNIDLIGNSPIVTEAQQLILNAVSLSTQLLKDNASTDVIVASVQSIYGHYQQFINYFNNTIANEQDTSNKKRWARQRDYIILSLNQFGEQFKLFTTNADNFLFKSLAGAYAAKFTLATLALDVHPLVAQELQAMRQVLISGMIKFFKANLKVILESLSLCYQRSDALGEDQKAQFDALFPVVMSTFQEATTKFLATTDESNPDSFTQCLHQTDRIHTILKPLVDIISGCEEQSLSAARTLLNTVEDTMFTLNRTFRFHIQISFEDEARTFVIYMGPFLDCVSNLFALQSDAVYQRFLQNKKPIESALEELKADFENAPPLGSFETDYTNSLMVGFNKCLSSCMTVITEANPLMKNSANNNVFKKCNTMLVYCINNAKNLYSFRTAIVIDNTCQVPGVTGYKVKKSCNDIGVKLNELVQKLQSDPASTPQVANEIAKELYEMYNILSQQPETKEQAEKLKQQALAIEQLVTSYSLGDQSVTQKLIETIQEIGGAITGLNQVGDQLVQQVTESAKPQEAQKTEQFTAEQAAQALVDTGKVLDAKGNEISEIKQIPSEKEVNDIFMLVNSSQDYEKVRGPMSSVVDTLKKKVEQFRGLAKEYNENPSPELLTKMKTIAKEIQEAYDVIQNAKNFAESKATPENIASSTPSENSSLNDVANFAFMLQTQTLERCGDTAEGKVLGQMINEGIRQHAMGDKQGLMKLQLVALANNKDMKEVEHEIMEDIKQAAEKNDEQKLQELLPKLMLADQIYKATNPATSAQYAASTSQAREFLLAIIEKGTISPEEMPKVIEAVEVFQAALYGGGAAATAEISDAQLSDTVMDLNQDITTCVSKTINDLKKFSAKDAQSLNTQIIDLKQKSISLTSNTLVAAMRRAAALNKDDVDDLSNEVEKLLDNLANFEKTSVESLSSSNKNTAVRNVGKIQREVTINISTISGLCDQFIEVEQTHEECYTGDALHLMLDVLRLSGVCDAPAASKEAAFKQSMPKVVETFNELKQRATKMLSGTDDFETVTKMLTELEQKFNGFNAKTMTFNDVIESVKAVNEIRQTIDTALNTEVKPQPEVASKLPFRFNAIPSKTFQPRPVADIKKDIDRSYAVHEKALEKLNEVLNNTRSDGETILAALNEYHEAANRLLTHAEHMRNSTWNPACQNRLLTCHTNMVSVGDSAIDACRARLLGQENWRQTVNAFIEQATNAAKTVSAAGQDAYDTIQQDLSATNEAEKELIIAAQNIQKSQGRLMSFKSQAEDQKVQQGANYIGVEIIDVSAPILNTSAKLIEAAQAQMKYCLARKPNLDNQTGMINTARNLVDSLDLILVAAEAIVNNDPDAINKVLAACNIISGAIAHFQAECRQKEGSPELNDVIQNITDQIQETIKHVRNFGETAQRKQAEEASKDVKTPTRALNKMVEKLNAEAKVVEAKRALEEAENRLKQARQKK